MRLHNLKRSIIGLFAVTLLNNNCQCLRNLFSSSPSTEYSSECPKIDEPYVSVYLHGLGDGRNGENGFAAIQEIEKANAKNVEQINIEVRSKDDNDFKLPIKEQVKETYKELVRKLQEGGRNPATTPLVLMGHSLGGLVAIKFYFEYRNKCNIKTVIPINSPLAGLPVFDLSLESLVSIQDALNALATRLPFPVKDVLNVAKEACSSGLGKVLLGTLFYNKLTDKKYTELVNSLGGAEKDKFKKLLESDAYKQLYQKLDKDYKVLMDIDNSKQEIYEFIHKGKLTLRDHYEPNDNAKAVIQLVHTSVDQSALNKLMSIFKALPIVPPSKIEPYINFIKKLSFTEPDTELFPTDGLLHLGAGLGLSRQEAEELRLTTEWTNSKPKKFYALSSQGLLNKDGYWKNTGATFSKGYLHTDFLQEFGSKDSIDLLLSELSGGELSCEAIDEAMPQGVLQARELPQLIMRHIKDGLSSPTTIAKDATKKTLAA